MTKSERQSSEEADRGAHVEVVQRWRCSSCQIVYATRAEARRCTEAARAAVPEFKVGDIVTADAGFGWYDGDARWIVNPDVMQTKRHRRPKRSEITQFHYMEVCAVSGDGNCFGDCCSYAFFYVVTRITIGPIDDIDRAAPHDVTYHVATGAMTGAKGNAGGWTRMRTHKALTLVERPPQFVVADSKRFIGRKFGNLL